MKNLKKNSFGFGLVFSILLGLGLSFVPQDVQARELELSKPKCYHQTSGESGAVNFCSGTTCVERKGTGSNFSKCG